jgi:WD40 repeat protein
MLGRRADSLYLELSEQGRLAAEQLFLRLVAVDEEGATVRRRVLQGELRTLSVDQAALETVLQRYAAHRLLTFDQHPITRSPTVEVAHEALITRWERLDQWVASRRDELALQHATASAAAEWAASEEDPSYLLRGSRLDQATAWVDDSDLAVTDEERRFVSASRAAADSERARVRRRRRSTLGAVAAAVLLVGTLGGLAIAQASQARREQAIALIGRLGAASNQVRASNPELALLLAMESVERAEAAGAQVPAETVDALNGAIQVSRVEQRFASGFRNIELSPEGRLVAVDVMEGAITASNEVRLVDLDTGTVKRSLFGPGRVSAMAWASTGFLAVAYGEVSHSPPSVVIWDTATGDQVATIEEQVLADWEVIHRMGWSPDGSRLAVMMMGTSYAVWDAATGELSAGESWSTDGLSPGDLVFRDEETLLVTRSDMTEVMVVEPSTLGVVDTIDLFGFAPARIALDRTGELMVFSDEDGNLMAFTLGGTWLWDRTASSGQRAAEAPALEVSGGDEGLIAVSGDDGVIRLLDPRDGLQMSSLSGQGGWVSDAVFTPDGTGLYSVSSLGTTLGWDATQKGPVTAKRLLAHDSVIELTVSPDGTSLAVQTDDGYLDIVDTTTGETRTERWPGGEYQNGGAPISPDWRHVAWRSASGETLVLDLATMDSVATLPEGASPRAFSPDGRLVAFSGWPDTGDPAGVIDWETGEMVLDLGVSYLVTAEFNPGGVFEAGRYMALIESDRVGRNNLLAIYDMSTGGRIADWEETDPIHLAFDPTGRYLAVGDVGGRAWVVDLALLLEGRSVSEATVFDVQAFDDIVWRVAISADGVLATSRSAEVRLWNIFDGVLVGTAYARTAIPALAFHPDGRSLMYTDEGIRTYWIDPQPLMPLARERATRDLTDHECVRYLGDACPSR